MFSNKESNTEIKQFLFSIIGNTPNGVLVLDLSYNIILLNANAVEFLGGNKSPSHYLGKPALNLISKNNKLRQLIEKQIKTGRDNFKIPELPVGNKTLSVSGDKILSGLLITLINISDIKNTQEVLRLQKQDLENKNADLERFAYIVTHDLKEPINTIISMVSVLTSIDYKKEKENFTQALKFIETSSYRLSNQVQGLLELTRVGRNKELEEIDLNKLVNNVLKDLSNLITELNTKIDLEKLPMVKGYAIELKSLFQNLLSNALKYRKTNELLKIEIGHKLHKGLNCFFIKDNGLGIPKNKTDYIFEIYTRLHLNSEIEGTGIGLSLCKKIVELHNGKIWVESVLGSGSTFYFTLGIS